MKLSKLRDESAYQATKKSRTKSTKSDQEICFNHEIILVEQTQESEDLHLEVGEYDYPFAYKLPDNSPTSFEHAHARVRYSVRAHVDIPWAFDLYSAI